MSSFDTPDQKNYPPFLGSEIEQGGPEAFFQILPVPYERTVSYGGGTAKGPAFMLDASWQLETWDGHTCPCDLGINTLDPINCSGEEQAVIDRIAVAIASVVRSHKFPIAFGGEHTVTGGVVKGLLDAGVTDFGVVQIDAHADLRDAYEGNPLSHASVMKRVVDLGIPLFQLGIRAFCEEERDVRVAHGVLHLDANELVPNNVSEFTLPDSFPKKVFFTLDIDGMDPSVFPSTGTPVPGGLGWYQTLSLFECVAKQREIIGFDIMEFAPIKGFHAYEFAAAQLAYKMMGIVQRSLAK